MADCAHIWQLLHTMSQKTLKFYVSNVSIYSSLNHHIMVEENTTNKVIQGKKRNKQLQFLTDFQNYSLTDSAVNLQQSDNYRSTTSQMCCYTT